MNYKEIIETIYSDTKNIDDPGQVASYIPELARTNPDKFGIHLATVGEDDFGIGDYQEKFSLQSIAKVLSLCLAYRILGSSLWKRVGVEPSGTPFNSLVQLEADNGIPRNSFINAGALVVCDVLISHLKNPKEDFIAFIRNLAKNGQLDYSQRIVDSEKSAGYRNIALCNFIKSFGNIYNDPEEVLDFYFNMCSLEMDCRELSKTFYFWQMGAKN